MLLIRIKFGNINPIIKEILIMPLDISWLEHPSSFIIMVGFIDLFPERVALFK